MSANGDFPKSADQISLDMIKLEENLYDMGENESGGLLTQIKKSLSELNICCPLDSAEKEENTNFSSPLSSAAQKQNVSFSSPSSSAAQKQNIRTGKYINKNIPMTAAMPVGRDEEDYNMSHEKRGVALIFNHEAYHFKLKDHPPREGTNCDVESLKGMLQKLEFDVEIQANLTKAEIISVINRVSQADHSRNDCFVLVCLTHGTTDDRISAYDAVYEVKELWEPFMNNNCLTLSGKPKLFFIQACRGNEMDEGVVLKPSLQNDAGYMNSTETILSDCKGYKISKYSDRLIMNATVEGYVAWLTTTGSPFIQALCKQMTERAFTDDLMSILTSVIREVVTGYESYHPGIEDLDFKKCIPEIRSTLMRKVKFSPKTEDFSSDSLSD